MVASKSPSQTALLSRGFWCMTYITGGLLRSLFRFAISTDASKESSDNRIQ